MAVTIGPKIGIDGEKEYRQEINRIITHTKTLSAEMKVLESAYKNENDTMKAVAEKKKLLNDRIETQTKYVEKLSKQLEIAEEKWGKESVKTEKWQQAVANATTELNNLKNQLDDLPTKVQEVSKKLEDWGKKIKKAGDNIKDFGKSFTRNISAPVAAGLTYAAKTAVDWESDFAGVMKTVDETATTTYADLEEAIKRMSTEMGVSKEEIAGVAEAAGQLGVSADDLSKFTEVMIKLGASTNMASADAAMELARFTNITGTSQQEVDKLGAALVDLGNNTASTEDEIMLMAVRLASAGTVAGLSAPEILGLSAAMTSVGIRAEAGGTAMSTTLTQIAKAVDGYNAGEEEAIKLTEGFAKVAGMSAEEFASTWNTHPVVALQNFIVGMDKVKEDGGSMFQILDDLGMSAIRQSNTLRSLALGSDVLTNSISIANEQFANATALEEEWGKRRATTALELQSFKEKLDNLAITLGDTLLPHVTNFLDKVSVWIEKFAQLDTAQQENLIKLGLFLVAMGPIITGIGTLISSVGAISQAFGWLGTNVVPYLVAAFNKVSFAIGTNGLAGGLSQLIPAINPVTIAIGAVIAAIVLWVKNFDDIKEAARVFCERTKEHFEDFKQAVTEKWTTLKETTSQTWQDIEGFVSENLDTAGEAIRVFGERASERWDLFKQATEQKFEEAFDAVTKFGGDVADKMSEMKDKMFEWGSDMISNLVAGIESLKSKVRDSASGIAEEIRKFLHFSQPDVGPLSDFNTWMPDMMTQMAAQIEGGRVLVQGAVRNTASDIAGINNVTNNTNSYGNNVINVYGSDKMDVRELADEVANRINQQTYRVGAAYA